MESSRISAWNPSSASTSTCVDVISYVPDSPGVYCLVLTLDQDVLIKTKAKTFSLKSGLYVYVGSAMQGLRKRVKRYLCSRVLRKHWHIDYLLDYANIRAITLSCTSTRKPRPEWILSRSVHALEPLFRPVPRFGSTDLKGVVSNLYRACTRDINVVLAVLAYLMKSLFLNVRVLVLG